VTLAEKSLDAAVFLTQARIASITSGMLSFIWQVTRLPWGSTSLMKSPACQKASHTLPKRIWLQTQHQFDERANDEATIL
jgi:hypothetical protein